MCDDEWEQFCNNEYSSISIESDTTKNRDDIPECPIAEELYISTKSKIGWLNKTVDLSDVFWKIPILPYSEYTEGIIKKQIKLTLISDNELDDKISKCSSYEIEDISKKKNKIVKKISIGHSTKDLISYRCKKKGAFYNCFVVIFRILFKGIFKEMHVKIFNTGKIELPGVPTDDLLNCVLGKIDVMLNSSKISLDISIIASSFECVLINSNFNCGFMINREKLVDIIKFQYKLCVSYDPCSYPGIMCKFYYYTNNKIQDGRLYKNIDALNTTKPICISFMIFRTGSVLIVGKCNNNEIIFEIYNYIKTLLSTHYNEIYVENNENNESSVKIKNKLKKIKRRTILVHL